MVIYRLCNTYFFNNIYTDFNSCPFSLVERKVAAKMQSRIGPYLVGKPHGLLQPLADALKLMLKDDSSQKFR